MQRKLKMLVLVLPGVLLLSMQAVNARNPARHRRLPQRVPPRPCLVRHRFQMTARRQRELRRPARPIRIQRSKK